MKKEGDEIGMDCPACSSPLVFEMSFQDMFNHKTGHYTIDRPMMVCSKEGCEYCDDYEEYYGGER